VSEDLLNSVQSSGYERIDVLIATARRPNASLYEDTQRAIALGQVHTYADYEAVRSRLVAARKQDVSADLRPIADAISDLGGEARPCTLFWCLQAHIPADKISAIAARSDVRAMSAVYPTPPASRQDYVLEGAQVKQFVDSGYDGRDRTGIFHTPLWTVGAGEGAAPDDEHVGFRDGPPNMLINPVRMYRYMCDDSSCWSVSNFANGDEHDHPTSCDGLIFGDLRDGQDSNIGDTATRIARSGYAGESWGRVYAGLTGTGRWTLALQDAVGGSPVTPLMNSSNGGIFDIPDCLGRTAFDHVVNDAFDDGLLVIWAGGNTYGHDDIPHTCTVEGPKAIGAFKVGTCGNYNWEDADDVRTAAISEGDGVNTMGSPRGGVSYDEGRWRSIIDVAGYGNYSTMFSTGSQYNFQSIGGATSQSTATVSGQATDFVDWFKTKYGSIPGPGLLHASLLLMGDRQGESGYLTSGFDNLWGAGRMRMRKFDPAGMDSPYGYAIGSTCVGNGQNVYKTMYDSSPFPSSIDVIKVVLYWFDRRVEDAPPTGVEVPDDIDLRVEDQYNGTWYTLASSISSYDNKERIRVTPISGRPHRIRMTGYNVTSDDAGCGTNSMKVYYAYFYEDSARDDADGPSASDVEVE